LSHFATRFLRRLYAERRQVRFRLLDHVALRSRRRVLEGLDGLLLAPAGLQDLAAVEVGLVDEVVLRIVGDELGEAGEGVRRLAALLLGSRQVEARFPIERVAFLESHAGGDGADVLADLLGVDELAAELLALGFGDGRNGLRWSFRLHLRRGRSRRRS